MRKPRALDLCCKAGGASMGLHRAGFDVIGIDKEPQPNYPFPFILGDALHPPVDLASFEFIWASPHCQRYTSHVRARQLQDNHPDDIPAMRALLKASGALYSIENVPGAPLLEPVVLTGDMFGLKTYRRRHFETNFFLLAPPRGRPFGPETRADAVTVCGHTGGNWLSRSDGRARRHGTLAEWKAAMEIDWMTGRELAQAVPPAYSYFIGRQAMRYIEPRRVAV